MYQALYKTPDLPLPPEEGPFRPLINPDGQISPMPPYPARRWEETKE